MDLKLSNRFALVSGSTAGIGHAIAAALADEGTRVIVNGREQSSVDEAVARSQAQAERSRVRRRSSTAAGARTLSPVSPISRSCQQPRHF